MLAHRLMVKRRSLYSTSGLEIVNFSSAAVRVLQTTQHRSISRLIAVFFIPDTKKEKNPVIENPPRLFQSVMASHIKTHVTTTTTTVTTTIKDEA